MTVQIHINGENAAQAVQELSALSSLLKFSDLAPAPVAPPQPAPQPAGPFVAQQPSAPAAYPPAYQAPSAPGPQAPYQAPPQQPVYTAPPQPGAVPTTAPTYTIDQLGVAAGPLVDAGRGPELFGWLNQRGAAALTHLDKAHYGEFAAYLRSLGAKI